MPYCPFALSFESNNVLPTTGINKHLLNTPPPVKKCCTELFFFFFYTNGIFVKLHKEEETT